MLAGGAILGSLVCQNAGQQRDHTPGDVSSRGGMPMPWKSRRHHIWEPVPRWIRRKRKGTSPEGPCVLRGWYRKTLKPGHDRDGDGIGEKED